MKSFFQKALMVLVLLSAPMLVLSQGKKTAEITIQTQIYCDHCEKCEDCKPRIIQHLEYLNGVRAADLDVKKMTVTVYYNPEKTTPELIRKAITIAGFEADGMPPDPEGYEALDSCCKKK